MPMPSELTHIEVGDVFIRDSDWARFMVFGSIRLTSGPNAGKRALTLEDDQHNKLVVSLAEFRRDFSPSESDSLFPSRF